MNIVAVTEELKRKFPGKMVVVTDPNNPTELICETEPTSDHSDWSEAIAVVDKIRPHYHQRLTETYKILTGKLTLYLDGEERVMHNGEVVTIEPGVVHWAQGNEVWMNVTSRPGWTADDHILVFDEKELSRKKFDEQ